MSPEIIFLIVVLAGSAVIGAAVGMTIERFFSDQRRKAWRAKNRAQWGSQNEIEVASGPWTSKPAPSDAADQLRIVMSATFTTQPLLNKREGRLFKQLDRMVLDRNSAWQVMAQVSLGEVLRSKDAKAYSCINSKRVDFLLMDDDCQPRHAIEYQGDGHHQGTAAARDAVKKEALRRAGIGYHEILAGHTTPAELRQLIDKLVDGGEQVFTKSGGGAKEASFPDNAGRPWSPKDDEELLRLSSQGKAVSDLASHFKRTPSAITARLERLAPVTSLNSQLNN